MSGSTDRNPELPVIVRTVADLRATVAGWRRNGESIALVPTMGALHEGHISLMRLGRELCDRVVATIFVNPTQFAPNEDFETYPRNEAADVAKLRAEGVDLLFAPDVSEMYPEGDSTRVHVSGLTDCLCGKSRPHFFDGVATVVSRLLLQALPDVALFGEKDYQQLQVIKRMTRDLHIPVEIVGGPTVREADGLALSSRNAYLSAEERAIAPALNRIMREVAAAIAGGAAAAPALAAARTAIGEAGFRDVDYLDLRDAETLEEVTSAERPARLLAAAWIGKTRLIDNVPVVRDGGDGG
jgi:pantoate--beta-alanine ligase